MDSSLISEDTDKLLALQEKCDVCKEAIVREDAAGTKMELHALCDKCKVLRVRVPELMAVKRKLMELNAK